MGTVTRSTDRSGRREARWMFVAACVSVAAALTALVSIVDRGALGAVPTGTLLCVLALLVLPVPTLVFSRRARALEARTPRTPDPDVIERVVHTRHDDRRVREHRVAQTGSRVHHGAA